jgi:hypothetical protein
VGCFPCFELSVRHHRQLFTSTSEYAVPEVSFSYHFCSPDRLTA